MRPLRCSADCAASVKCLKYVSVVEDEIGAGKWHTAVKILSSCLAVSEPLISRPEVHGKRVIAKASTESWMTSTEWRNLLHIVAGGSITIGAAWSSIVSADSSFSL